MTIPAENPTCPSCGEPDWDGENCESCAYSELRCPFCDARVSSIGSEPDDTTTEPYDCVVLWGNYGDDSVWEDERFRQKAFRLYRKARRAAGESTDEELEDFSPGTEDIEELFEGDSNVKVLAHDDGGGHGHSIGSWFVFVRRRRGAQKRHSASE